MAMKHYSTLCCCLLLVMLHSHQTSAAERCSYASISVPFCKSWMCRTERWIESQLITSNTMNEYKCIRGGIKRMMSLLFL
ncbi:hypothetical protein BS78_06G028500 [Paspalum vaginatum]|nr:hypothetical protein BS78_06G028500 [Paspalum vaginatum]